jgi:hypothetical protein
MTFLTAHSNEKINNNGDNTTPFGNHSEYEIHWTNVFCMHFSTGFVYKPLD